MTTGHVPGRRRVLGLDLGGARKRTTGFAVLEGSGDPRLTDCGVLPREKTAELAERRLLEFIEDVWPDVLSIDAPLTLPPCLTCSPSCPGPGRDLCELEAARLVWDAHGHPLTQRGHPVTERLCEVLLRNELQSGSHPLPTMRIGQIGARGFTLARRIATGTTKLKPAIQVLEVYPYATLARLKDQEPRLNPRKPVEKAAAFAARVVAGLAGCGLDLGGQSVDGAHAVDALIAAYTGWLAPDNLEAPPADFNVASGWIWLPKLPPPT